MAEHMDTLPILKPSGAAYDDLVAAPSNLIAEIVDGRLYGTPRPPPRLSTVASRLNAIVGSAECDRWWLLWKVEIHLREDVLVPDLSGWRRDRLPNIPDAPWMSSAPEWACEVMASPSEEHLDRVVKLPVYAREGVACVWLVKPLTRTLEVYRRNGTNWTLVVAHGGYGKIRVEPFDSLEWDLGRLWADLDG
jgi:Putative restriction endonuclease